MRLIPIIVYFLFIPFLALAQLGSSTTMKKIDEIQNNTGTDIILNPTDKVDINYFTGDKALQSTADGELEESNVTNTELNHLTGATSNIQNQLDSKAPNARLINTTAPLQGGGDLSADRTLTIDQANTTTDGYLTSTDWNTFNDKQDSLPLSTDGDLLYYNGGFARLPIGTAGQVLTVNGSLLPEWQDIVAVSVTTKGDIQTYSTEPDRLPVGANGQLLSANSATATGLEWINPPATSPTTTLGDIIYNDGGGAASDTRLPIGAEDQVLTVSSGLPVWEDVAPSAGGSAGINFVSDDSFEAETLNPDTNSATETYQTFTTDAQLYSESNTKYFRAAYTGLSAVDTYVRDSFARTGLDDKQGFFSIWVKANADDFQLCLRVDDASFAAACDSALTTPIVGDNTWRKYEIPFVFGASTVEYEIFNESYTGDVTIEVDKIYVGTTPDGYIKDVAVITPWVRYDLTIGGTTTDPTKGTATENAQWRRVGDSIEINYSYDQTASGSDGSGVYTFSLPEGLSIDLSKVSTTSSVEGKALYGSASASLGPGASTTSGFVQAYTSTLLILNTGDETSNMAHVGSSNFGLSNSAVNFTFTARVPIQGWSATSGAIVAQGNNAQDVSARYISQSGSLANASTIVKAYETKIYDTTNSYDALTGVYTVPESGYYLVKSSFTLDSLTDDTGRFIHYIRVNGSSQKIKESSIGKQANREASHVSAILKVDKGDEITIAHYHNNGGTLNYNTSTNVNVLEIKKLAPSTGTIVGKFANINSSELVEVSASGSAGSSITAGDPIDFPNESIDNYSAWNGSAFTAPKAGTYDIEGMLRTVSTALHTVRVLKNDINNRFLAILPATDDRVKFSGKITLAEGDTLKFVNSQTFTPVNDTNINWVHIQELPDTESIIKNFADQSTLECQTKYLSGLTADGVAATFNNLETTENYSIEFNTYFAGITDGEQINCYFRDSADNERFAETRFYVDVDASSTISNNFSANAGNKFKPSYTTYQIYCDFLTAGTGDGSLVAGSAGSGRSYATLCQLRSNTILNSNKWD